MGEVAPEAVRASGFLPKCITWFGFIRVLVHITSEFLHTVSELALIPIRAVSLFREVPTKGAFHFILDHILLLRLETTVL